MLSAKDVIRHRPASAVCCAALAGKGQNSGGMRDHFLSSVANCLNNERRWLPMQLTAVASVTAGIDNDVKIWTPTAVRAQEPAASPAVQRLLRDNSTGRGRSRAMQQVRHVNIDPDTHHCTTKVQSTL